MATVTLASRLATVLHYLNRGYTVNIKDLSDEFDISERQIQKDIELFSDMYEIDSLGSQNYKMKKGYKLIGTENEDVEIAIALMKSLQQSALPQMNEEVDKALAKSEKYGDIFLFNIDNEEISQMKEFRKFLQAIRNKQSCSFIYTKKDGSSKEVHAHPYRIANLSNYWYLLAYDVEAERLKSYHINSIDRVVLAGENYINDAAVEKEIEDTFVDFTTAWFDGELKSVMLHATGHAKHYLERNSPKNVTLISRSDTEIEIQFDYYNEIEVLNFVKKWLPDVRIVNSTGLKQKLQESLQSYLKTI